MNIRIILRLSIFMMKGILIKEIVIYIMFMLTYIKTQFFGILIRQEKQKNWPFPLFPCPKHRANGALPQGSTGTQCCKQGLFSPGRGVLCFQKSAPDTFFCLLVESAPVLLCHALDFSGLKFKILGKESVLMFMNIGNVIKISFT
jgi:hypothetical protein